MGRDTCSRGQVCGDCGVTRRGVRQVITDTTGERVGRSERQVRVLVSRREKGMSG